LKHAHDKSQEYYDAIKELDTFNKSFNGKVVIPRSVPKKIERFEAKKKYGNFFKLISDWIGFRVVCQVGEIEQVCQKIKKNIEEKGGKFFVKNDKLVNDAGHLEDIVQFAYCYLPGNYIAEFQIGHPFSFVVFKHDNAIRDNQEMLGSDGKKLYFDFWKKYCPSIVGKSLSEDNPYIVWNSLLEDNDTCYYSIIKQSILYYAEHKKRNIGIIRLFDIVVELIQEENTSDQEISIEDIPDEIKIAILFDL
jgi:hypothetical protein